MKTTKVIECETDNITFGWYDEKEDKFYEIESVKTSGKITHEQLINAVADLADNIRLNVSVDLHDLWNRIDALEKKIDVCFASQKGR